MTAKRKSELVRKFLNWLNMLNCSARCFEKTTGHLVNVVCEVVELGKDGQALNTLCYETFPDGTSVDECWIGCLSRRCKGKLLFDEFHRFGLGDASTLEELELKLEICAAGTMV